ncbi:hypothetical protein [Flammeovirga sp. SubArs3]|uniref:hypothetical protein n=1 Tax=Flammeovirga sp. SubArs3 TaxID=2995316 RepID=UPI00248C0E59|nr:hypothetical protein [Flammeovirga sp. SubArs3]
MNNKNIYFKISSVLWLIWGFVHIMAGVITDYAILNGDIIGAVSGIADAIDPNSLQANYPNAAGAIIGQHGFNLLWIGVTTFICSIFIWKGNKNAILLAILTGGLADVGYFLFMDLGGYVRFAPGTLMTIVSSLAIVSSLIGLSKNKQQNY